MVYNILSVLHEFFFFLSTTEGILFRSAVEFLIFLLVTYMIISEYLRERNVEHKYLSMAFASIGLQRFITVVVYSNVVFGSLKLSTLEPFMPVVLNFLEAFAFILLVNAFVYPHRKSLKKIVSSIERETLALLIIAVIIEFLWLKQISINSYARFDSFYGFAIFGVIKTAVLAYPVFIILRNQDAFKRRHNIIAAFIIYAIVPFLQTISFLVYGNLNPRIDVFLNPFPFISVMLFTKIVYLKLVDKATLKDQLRISQEKYREAKELSEMKDSFVSVVSHELRTPLTSIKLYANLLTSGKFGAISEKQKKTLGIINQETDRLSNLIEDILHLSKLESNREALKIGRFNFYEFAKNNPLYELAREKGIKVKANIPKGFSMNVDAEKFKLVFINLISNAIKFTDKGGLITVSANSDDEKWSIGIKDTGKGIAKEHIPRLFDKFFQVENYMIRDKGGTGLGLAIAKRIVDLHHGDIKADSDVGKGSTFTVVVPKA